jgi:hypothetical protein
MGKYMTKIIEQYNNTPCISLHNNTPNNAISDPAKRMHVMHLNIQKAQQNRFITDLEHRKQVE